MNKDYKNFLITENDTISNCSLKMNKNNSSFLIVVNQKKLLLGTFSMGDLRNALYHGAKLNSHIIKYYNTKPTFVFKKNYNLQNLKKIFLSKQISVIPIVDTKRKIIGTVSKENVFKFKEEKIPKIDLPVVIMSGGKGSRLKPFSDILPKALIPLNNKTVLERIIENFLGFGVKKIFIITNYKSNIIKSYFDEKKYKRKLKFIEEPKELGTAGGLKLIYKELKENFLVTNCDVLHDFNYEDFVKFHIYNKFHMSVVGSFKSYSIPYGICELDKNGILNKIDEKPKKNMLINTGFYIIKKKLLKYIPKNKFFHITDLISKAKSEKNKIGLFPINDNNWSDVGEWSEYYKTNNLFNEN
jgi:dTDP-glucose pyrophosphorylase